MTTQPDTRVFLVQTGEPTVDRVREALLRCDGLGETWTLEEIVDVGPMDEAFNEMLQRADLRFHVQVDADMELEPHAIERLRAAMLEADEDVWQIGFCLWDTLFRRSIQAVKIYRSDVARRFPYRSTRRCEIDQIARARREGLRVEMQPLPELEDDPAILGKHLVNDPRTAFWNCRDRALKWRWLEESGPGRNPMGWIMPYLHVFLERYAAERDPRFLYAFTGFVAGLSGELPKQPGEKDFRSPPPELELLHAKLSLGERDWMKLAFPKSQSAELDRLARSAGHPSWRAEVTAPSRGTRWLQRARGALRSRLSAVAGIGGRFRPLDGGERVARVEEAEPRSAAG